MFSVTLACYRTMQHYLNYCPLCQCETKPDTWSGMSQLHLLQQNVAVQLMHLGNFAPSISCTIVVVLESEFGCSYMHTLAVREVIQE